MMEQSNMKKVKVENIHTWKERKLRHVKCKIMVHKRSVRRLPIDVGWSGKSLGEGQYLY